jgi:hypothetical protein
VPRCGCLVLPLFAGAAHARKHACCPPPPNCHLSFCSDCVCRASTWPLPFSPSYSAWSPCC